MQVIFALAMPGSMLRLFLHLSSDVDVGRRGAVISLKTSPCVTLGLPQLCSRGWSGAQGGGQGLRSVQ